MAEAARQIVNTLRKKPEELATDAMNRVRSLFGDIKAKVTGDDSVSFEEAALILSRELHFPKDKAISFVQRFDKNKDGRLSRGELEVLKKKLEDTRTQLVPKFKEYDSDNNGFITLDEAGLILQRPPFNFPHDRIFLLLKSFDRDGNGQLDIEEFAGFYAEAKALKEDISECFDRLDKDGNGVLSPEEVASVIQERLGFEAGSAKQLIETFDQNRDGCLDKGEFINLWTSMFGE